MLLEFGSKICNNKLGVLDYFTRPKRQTHREMGAQSYGSVNVQTARLLSFFQLPQSFLFFSISISRFEIRTFIQMEVISAKKQFDVKFWRFQNIGEKG